MNEPKLFIKDLHIADRVAELIETHKVAIGYFVDKDTGNDVALIVAVLENGMAVPIGKPIDPTAWDQYYDIFQRDPSEAPKRFILKKDGSCLPKSDLQN